MRPPPDVVAVLGADGAAALLTGTCVVLGLLVGSFLNVVVWRVPRGASVVSPPSACPACGTRIRARDNVPVVSWLVLRGRCRDCAAPISARYPLVEAGTGALFGLAAWWVGWDWVLPAVLYVAGLAVALALIDLDVRRLPDALVLPSYPVLVALLVLASASPGGTSDWPVLGRSLLGAAAFALAYGLIWVVYPGGMGLGDVKLAGLLGLLLGWFGWGAVVVGFFAAFLLAGLVVLGLLAARRIGRRSAVAFGPWMLVGAAVGAVAGPRALDAYVALFTGLAA
ncbi:prepilin peptidase [Cellulomonas sp. P4]|uniref:prepilin peptidase n=1 Tax=Cellulomonas sp. P4 TaxID=3142533 RepID=UPI0031B9B909